MENDSLLLEGRLLSAINHSYRLASSSVPPATGPTKYAVGAGFLADPVSFDHEEYGTALALVGTTEEGVIVTFRCPLLEEPDSLTALWEGVEKVAGGTYLSPRVKSWPKGTRVLSGAWKPLASIWQELRDEIKKQVEAGEEGNLPVFFGGHNSGGVMAALAAMRLHAQEDLTAKKIVTFGAPKPGNSGFAEAYQSVFKSAHIRYEAAGDLFPYLPANAVAADIFSAWPESEGLGSALKGADSVSVGTLRYIRLDGEVRTGSKAPAEKTRIKETATHIAELIETDVALRELMNSHRPGCGFTYFSAVTPEGYCDPVNEEETGEEGSEESAGDETEPEDWEKGLISNTGCFPVFGWFFGLGSRK